MAINLREIEVFKPYSTEFPEDLLLGEGATEADVDAWAQSQTLRVAKRDTQVLGAYAMNRLSSEEFHLLGVVVAHPYRKQGLGRWLVGHGIGVAESKGGRRVSLAQTGGSRCFAAMGFNRQADTWVFDLIQE